LAIVFRELSEPALSNLYRDSAFRAWEWAEQAFAAPDNGLGDAKRMLEFSGSDYVQKLKPFLQQTGNARIWAGATLFRLTGEDRFNRAVLDRLSGRYDVSLMDAAWEYTNAQQAGAEVATQDKLRSGIVAFARDNIVQQQHLNVAYRNMKIAGAPIGWGEGLAPRHEEAAALIRAHRVTSDEEFVAAMLDGSAHILGANQIGMSFTVGLGYRCPVAPLHEDSIAAGVPPPIGITIYGWVNPATMGTYWSVWGPTWAALSDDVPSKRIEPKRASLPLYEYLIEYPRIVASAEYTVHQSIVTTAAIWTYLYGYRAGGR
jgi:endoglucanase